MKHGYVISDLHLFANRSVADDHLGSMRAAAAHADYFVLNGDIFDFRWTTLASAEATARAAADWLEQFSTQHPRCQFFYVLGNHDGLSFFTRHLDDLARRTPNFHWYPSHVRIGDALFLHGDLPLGRRRKRRAPFDRSLRQHGRRMSAVLHAAYGVLVFTGAHRWGGWWHWRRRCAKRILRALRNHRNGLGEGLKDVYFGHTHRVFRDYSHEGVAFHNTGSTVQGLECGLLKVRPQRRGETPRT